MSECAVELKNVTKKFPGVVALRNMSLSVKRGEIHGLIGENGAGKSTLIKVLTGVHLPEEGEIFVDGKKMVFQNPLQSQNAGIACVYQELNIVRQLSVTDNIFMGRLINKGILLDYAQMEDKAKEILANLGHPEIDVRMECGKLGVGQQQIVEIARAIMLRAKLIIMDEPTSALGKEEIAQLMQTCRSLKERGIAVLFVSHKLEELFELCDRVTVMRDGEWILTEDISKLDENSLIYAMVGRSLTNLYPKEFGAKGDVWLEVRNLSEYGVLHDISFKAYAGQITAFAGLVGAGRTELMRAIFGADKFDSGDIFVKGKKVKISSPKDAISYGIGFLTEDRKNQGLVLSQSVNSNMILANLKGFSKRLFIQDDLVKEKNNEIITSLRIKAPSLAERTEQLSGGNQQKVVIGKWLNTSASIFIFDEPTRGIDVGAKIEVYNIMNQLVSEGKCVIMVSSELPEVLSMSDHVVVMREGTIMAEFDRDSEHFNSEDIMKAAWGGELENAE